MRGFWGNKGRDKAAAVETREELAEAAGVFLAFTRSRVSQETLRRSRGTVLAREVRRALVAGLRDASGSFDWQVEAAGKVMGGVVDALLVRLVRADLLTVDDLLLLAMASIGLRMEQQGGDCGCPLCRAERAGYDGGAKRPGRGVQ